MSVPTDVMNKPRVAPLSTDAYGNAVHRWSMTSPKLTDLVQLPLPPDSVLPVIFVPGIMGSNLKSREINKTTGEPVWRLDVTASIPTRLMGKIFDGPGSRQAKLHPARTDVDEAGDIPGRPAGSVSDPKAYRNRFWGEVAEGSYHSFLLWLEEALNGQGFNPARWTHFSYTSVGPMPKPGEQAPEPRLYPGIMMKMGGLPEGAEKGLASPIMSDDLLHRARFRMPVFACGYNWLDSNEAAAERLQRRVAEVMALYGNRCQQVILVTHSMGGLVARRCAQLPGMAEKIAGVVHGVMPSQGAAVAYRRCKVGMADEGSGLMAKVGALVIGNNGREVTAVFAQAPGALQLLPTLEYGMGWLKVRDTAGQTVECQPLKNPYEDIYLRRDRWWGLIREKWLAPVDGIPIKWTEYKDNIHFAREFHASILGAFHRHTYAFYGDDSAQPSFEGISWNMQNPQHVWSHATHRNPPSADEVRSMGFDDVVDVGHNPAQVGGDFAAVGPYSPYPIQTPIRLYLRCGRHDGSGDGTVPTSSGAAPIKQDRSGGIQQQFRLRGFDHEAAYKNGDAQQVTLYALMKIAVKARLAS